MTESSRGLVNEKLAVIMSSDDGRTLVRCRYGLIYDRSIRLNRFYDGFDRFVLPYFLPHSIIEWMRMLRHLGKSIAVFTIRIWQGNNPSHPLIWFDIIQYQLTINNETFCTKCIKLKLISIIHCTEEKKWIDSECYWTNQHGRKFY